MNSLHFNKEYHCHYYGAKRSSSWPGTPFWPISLTKNQQKGCRKGWNTKFHQIRFSASQTIPYYIRSTPVVFWVEKRPWVERGGSLRKYSCQKMNWYSAQTTGGVRLAPNFVNHLLMLFHYGVHQKSHIFRHLLCWPPLVKWLNQEVVQTQKPPKSTKVKNTLLLGWMGKLPHCKRKGD